MCKKTMTFLFALLLSVVLMPQLAWAATYATWTEAANTAQEDIDYEHFDYNSDGKEDLVIHTTLGLAWLAASVNGQLNDGSPANNYLSADNKPISVYLTSDIDLAPAAGAIVEGYTANGNDLPTDGTNPTVNADNSWIPIGNDEKSFNGHFFGNNHTINNVYINNSVADYQGLFGYASKLDGILIVNSHISASNYVGAIAGYNAGSAYSITNCSNEGTVIGIGDYVGGLSGYAQSSNASISIYNCYNTGLVQGNSYVGGILGGINNINRLENSYNTGTIKGHSNVGGLFGSVEERVEIQIANNYNWGEIEVSGDPTTASNIGALVGSLPDIVYDPSYPMLDRLYYQESSLSPVGNYEDDEHADSFTAMSKAQMLSPDFVDTLNEFFAKAANSMLWQAGQNTPPVYSDTEFTSWFDLAQAAQINIDFSLYQDDSKQNTVANLDDAGYIEIHTAYGLAWFAASVNNNYDSNNLIATTQNKNDYKGKSVKLTADIDLAPAKGELVAGYSDTGNDLPPYIAEINSWIPIGSGIASDWFLGTFDGNNYTISNIYINNDPPNLGLFGYIEDAIIKNVNIDQSNINFDDYSSSYALNSSGAITGQAKNSQILNCTNSGTIEGSGIVGFIYAEDGSSLIDNCHNFGLLYASEVLTYANIGGIAGQASSDKNNQDARMIIQNCSNSAAIANKADKIANVNSVIPIVQAGGIVGIGSNIEIYNCYNTGSLMAATEISRVGGIVGEVPPLLDITLNNCYNSAIPTSTQYDEGISQLGGILGVADANPINNSIIDAQNCYYQGASGLSGLNIDPDLNITDNTIAMTAEQMANRSFADTLNAWPIAQASTEFMTWAKGSPGPYHYAYWPQFMPIPDIDRGDNLGGGGTAVEEPSTEEPANANQGQVDIDIAPVISDNNAQADIEDNTLTQATETLLEQTENTDNAPQLNLDVNSPADSQSVEVNLTPAALATLAAANNSSFKISTSIGSITFDNQALNSIIKQANGQKITIIIKIADDLSAEQQAAIGTNPAYQLLIKAGDTYISNFDGGLATITIPYSSGGGQVMAYHIDALGQASAKPTTYNVTTQEASFTSEHFSAFMIMEQHLPFSDIATDDWFYEAISYAYVNNIMNGVSATEFSPNTATTRAMIWTVLARIDGYQFTTEPNPWYAEAQTWAIANGISDGENPLAEITREQFATMLYRYAAPAAITGQTMLAQFSDNANISEYAIAAMEWAVASGIISGYQDGTILPQGIASRAEIATMLMRYLEME